ncbi:MAG: type I phosphomannose isomerase catalytic subunit [Verrucomicrobiota bacterium]
MALLIFEPVYQERIWGGQNLHKLFHRTIPEDKPIGESWEICDRPEVDVKVIADGKPSSETLHSLWISDEKAKIFGTKAPQTERFPILIKLLDAQEKLSLQVHPPAKLAPKFKGEPKTELWYFLESTDEANIYVGLKKGITRKKFAAAIEDKTVAECFHEIKTKNGEVMFLPSGRVHAIGGGNVILEIQQNSDTTFRVYDWDRVGQDGKPRELHIEQSLECIDFDDFEPIFTQRHGQSILACKYFNIFRTDYYDKEDQDIPVTPESCRYLFAAQGNFKINGEEYPRGTSLLATADSGTLETECLDDYGELVSVTFPQ